MDLPKETQFALRLPRIGVGGPDVRLKLMRADEAGEAARPTGADPFVEVSAPDATFRAYLAHIRLGETTDPKPLIVLMEANERPAALVNQPLWTSSHVESAWRSGFEAIRTAGSGTGLARIDASAGDTVPHHPPVAYCPVSDSYAVPFCPSCRGTLSTCRDEEILRRCGLPSFESGSDRFLYCAACYADDTRPNVFYTYKKRLTGTPAAGIEVRHRHDLYSDLSSRVDAKDPAFATHGCFVCKSLRASLPEGASLELEAHDASRIFPLAYYDFDYVVREALPLGFEETASLLGGASLTDLLAHRAVRRNLGATRDGAAVIESLTGDVPQFFFQGDRTGLFPLESLYLKLAAFGDLIDGVLRLTTDASRPHLAVSPHRVRGTLRGRDTHLPSRWGLALCVTDALSTAPLEKIGDHDFPKEPPVWLIPEPRVGAFLPVPMTRAQTVSLQMRLDARTVDLQGVAETARAHLSGTLQSEIYTQTDHGRHDRVVVSLIGPASGHRIRFTGRRTETFGGGFAFSGISGDLRPEDAAALRTPGALSGVAAEVTLVHQFGSPSDLLALGLLYFRLLFWNDRQDGARLSRDLLQRIAMRLTGRDRGETQSRGAFEWPELEEILDEEKVAFGPNTLLHRAEDRETHETLPLSLWSEVWLVGLRMASFVPGWSFAAGVDGYETKDPGAPLRRARDAVRGLADQARASLIGSSGRNRYVLETVQDFLDDLTEAMSPSPQEEPGPDETTLVFGTEETAMSPQLGLDDRDLAPAIEEIRRILASEEYPEARHRKAAIRRILHASAAGLDQGDLKKFMERIRARFPDRTYESLALARELEARNRELEEENRALREERDALSERMRGTDAALDRLWGRMVSGDTAGGRAIIGGSGAAAPRRPDLLEPAFEGLGSLIEFAQKLETIAVEVEKSLGPRGARPIDPPAMAELWRSVGRNEGDVKQHLALIQEKLRYLGLLPAATVAGANQSWKGGTRLILEHLDPEKVEDAVSKKLPVLRDKAVLDEVRNRFQEFWSQLDKNITHYYRGTFEKVYAEKMEERR